MNAATGQWQLKRIILRYSETGGDSLGLRFFLRHLLPAWQERNPQVQVSSEHSQFEHARMFCEWVSGEKYEVSLRKLKARQIEDHMNLMRNSESPNLYLKHGGPKVWTERRSIQGLWQPSMEGMIEAVRWARRRHLGRRGPPQLKYSWTTLQLTRQHLIEQRGRWGDQSISPKGFDRHVLEPIFNEPFRKLEE
eukprot:gnl/TRDRNA2_/TRDRNA2_96936_c0_seq1.p1 gnl/TRDRNA2_/TRDRNA2_96936_c0~~gnl/TRDRNA2_/TRDRNA2_96936_c0_seq1.p1  ORF type:complete len:193 (-),score=30.84 gnl/TRDRNA2_/TRDRNA2_96936_c0_seq1:85-663(-)